MSGLTRYKNHVEEKGLGAYIIQPNNGLVTNLMTLVTRHDAYEPASKHTVYQRCLSTRAILCGIITKRSEFQIIPALVDMAEIFL